MSPDLRDLYQEAIIDHSRRPHNFGPLAGANHSADGFNPLCGDKVTVYVKLTDGVIEAAGFEGEGCAIATASASLMTDALKGKTAAQAETLIERFRVLVTGATQAPPLTPQSAGPAAPGASNGVATAPLGKLEMLAGVREFPLRVKCATLAWHTLHAALHDQDRPVSTE